MSESNSSGGANHTTSGSENQTETQTTTQDTVAYDTYRKVLSEKKKRDEELTAARAQLAEFQAKEKALAEEKLLKEKNYETLLKTREEELAKEREEKKKLRNTVEKGVKRRAFLDAVNGEVEEQYWKLIDLDQIALDPATGMPDQSSVQAVARDFEKTFGLVIKRPSDGAKLPNEAAKGNGGKLTHEEWLKLPLKEQKARLKEVI